MVWGAYKSHKHLSCQNITNGILTLTVMLPSILLIQYMNQQCIDKINDEKILNNKKELGNLEILFTKIEDDNWFTLPFKLRTNVSFSQRNTSKSK